MYLSEVAVSCSHTSQGDSIMKQHTFVTPVATAVKKGLALTLFPVALMLTGCSQSQAPANQAEQSVQQQQADYLNTALPLEERVKALVDSMTLEEKIM